MAGDDKKVIEDALAAYVAQQGQAPVDPAQGRTPLGIQRVLTNKELQGARMWDPYTSEYVQFSDAQRAPSPGGEFNPGQKLSVSPTPRRAGDQSGSGSGSGAGGGGPAEGDPLGGIGWGDGGARRAALGIRLPGPAKLTPQQEAALKTYDIEGLRHAKARDEQTALRGQIGDVYDRMADPTDMERQRADFMDARRYAEGERRQLQEITDGYRQSVERGTNQFNLWDSGRLSRADTITALMTSAGIDAVWGGGNKTMDLVNKMVDRDIRSQELQIEQQGQLANNALAQFERALGDRDQARVAYRSMLYDTQIASLEKAKNGLEDSQARQQIDQSIIGLQREKYVLEDKWLREAEAARQAKISALLAARAKPTGFGGLDKDSRKRLGDMDKRVGDQARSLFRIREMMANIEAMKRKYGGEIPGAGWLEGRMGGVLNPIRGAQVEFGLGDAEKARDALYVQNMLRSATEEMMKAVSQGNPSDREEARKLQIFKLENQPETTIMDILGRIESLTARSVYNQAYAVDPEAAEPYMQQTLGSGYAGNSINAKPYDGR